MMEFRATRDILNRKIENVKKKKIIETYARAVGHYPSPHMISKLLSK